MQNSHLRLGRLEYQRNTARTNTQISVHVSHYMGDKDQGHLLSFFGRDAEVAAVTAAIHENHHFQLRFPDGSTQRIGFGAEAVCYKGSLSLRDQKVSLRHVVAVSSVLHANGSAGHTYVVNDGPETQEVVWATLVSLLGVPAAPNWGTHILGGLRADNKIVPISGIGCVPSVIHATREDMLDRLGRACACRKTRFPETNGAVPWPSFEINDLLLADPTLST